MTMLRIETDLPDLRIVHGLAERQDLRGSAGDFSRRKDPADSKKFENKANFFPTLNPYASGH